MAKRRYGKVDGRRVLIVRHMGCDGFVVKFTHSCSGCTETMDGHNVNGHPMHPRHHCLVGSGCEECGYTGLRRRAEWTPMGYHAERYFKRSAAAYERDLAKAL